VNAVDFRRIADQLIAEVRIKLLSLREPCYGGVPITDEQAEERARAIVAGLLGNYAVKELS
jgi:hypothetical protein